MRTLSGLLALTVGLGLVGCGPTGPKTVKVSGKVTFNGEPVADGSIQFAGTGNDAASIAIKNGEYGPVEVTLGQKKVVIEGMKKVGTLYRDEKDKSSAYDDVKPFLPAEFNRETKLTADITGPKSDLNFDLKGKEDMSPRTGVPANTPVRR